MLSLLFYFNNSPRSGMVAIENKVDTKVTCDANIESPPNWSAKIDVVLPAGMPVIMTEILISSGSRCKHLSVIKIRNGRPKSRQKVK